MSFANNFLYNEKASFVAFFDLPPFLTANCSFLPDFIQKNLFKICLKNYLFVSISLFGFQWSFFVALATWWAQVDSNHRPRAYQARALTCWAMSPFKLPCISSIFRLLWSFRFWWRWWDSNPWPPACRAGALPAELHPHIRVLINNEYLITLVEIASAISSSIIHYSFFHHSLFFILVSTVPENWTTGDLLNLFLLNLFESYEHTSICSRSP